MWDTYVACGKSVVATAKRLKMPYSTVEHIILAAKMRDVESRMFQTPDLPDEVADAATLLKRQADAFKRKHAAKEARRLIPVQIKATGPIGLAHFGDPHLDDDGTNIELLQAHVAAVNKTDGLFAVNVGDTTNNWIDRLARLYGEQSTSAKEAWVLAEWLFEAMPWLLAVSGNHDDWSGEKDPLKPLARKLGILYEKHGARLGLTFPNGRVIRLNARHDFRGRSMWNTAHGPSKAAQMGWRDHLLTCGHTHVSGYQVLKDPASGLITHALRVASYKTHDRYGDQLGLPDQHIFVCPVTILDPAYADDDPRCVTTIFDPERAAEFLTWLRKRKGTRGAA